MELPASAENLTALIIGAANDNENANTTALPDDTHPRPLQAILRALERDVEKSADLLEPLVVVPVLLNVNETPEDALELLSFIARNASAKECILASAEQLERLCGPVQSLLDNDDDDATDADVDEEGERLMRNVDVAIHCLKLAAPRVALRKRTLTDTCTPWISLIQRAVDLCSQMNLPTQRQASVRLLETVAAFCATLDKWSTGHAVSDDDRRSAKDAVADLLLECVGSLYPALQPSLALRLYEAQDARLIMRSAVPPGWEPDHNALEKAVNAYTALHSTPRTNSGALVIHAHSTNGPPIALITLTALLPLILAHLQLNHAPDAPLALLLRFLAQPEPEELPDELLAPLVPILAALCAAHPHPPTRLMLLRGLLTPALARARAPLRLVLLADLAAPDTAHPAAAPLARAAVLTGLRTRDAPFGTPRAMQTLAPLLLRAPDEIYMRMSAEEFVQSSEPARVTEALLFYYAVLSADGDNKTGIRDKDSLRSVERDLLAPLRARVPEWIAELQQEDTSAGGHAHGHEHGHGHAVLALAGLETALGRVDEARMRL